MASALRSRLPLPLPLSRPLPLTAFFLKRYSLKVFFFVWLAPAAAVALAGAVLALEACAVPLSGVSVAGPALEACAVPLFGVS